jgi:hypothetical protein
MIQRVYDRNKWMQLLNFSESTLVNTRWYIDILIISLLCNVVYCIIIKIVSHNSSREHRALIKFRHLTRFLASTLTSFRVLPWSLISSKIVLRHVVWGLPRDLVPWGFHSKAAFAMSPSGRRSVWPSHPHFLCRISSSIGRTGQNIFSILRIHLMTRTWELMNGRILYLMVK